MITLVLLIFLAKGLRINHFNPDYQKGASQLELQQIAKFLSEYRNACGFFPSTQQGLGVIDYKAQTVKCNPSTKPETSADQLKDGWDQPYKYSFDGTHYRIEASHDLFLVGP